MSDKKTNKPTSKPGAPVVQMATKQKPTKQNPQTEVAPPTPPVDNAPNPNAQAVEMSPDLKLKLETRKFSIENLMKLADNEMEVSKVRYQKEFNSPHEFYGVLCEEIEEVNDDMQQFFTAVQNMWGGIKHDDINVTMENASIAYSRIMDSMAEQLQVAAIIKKFVVR